MPSQNYQYVISQNSKNSSYQIWSFDINHPSLLKEIKYNNPLIIPEGDQIIQVGNYVLQWSAMNKDEQYTYRLLEFNPEADDPLGSFNTNTWTNKAVQAGTWAKKKFFGSRSDFSNPQGAKKGYEKGDTLKLVSLHNFVLNWIPTQGRGTYQLFNFDNGSSDPLPAPVTPQGAWLSVELGHELIPIGGYVIDYEKETGNYNIWQFDAQSENPLSYPAINKGNWNSLGITEDHELIVMGTQVISWNTKTNEFQLWNFNATSADVLISAGKTGKLPNGINENSILNAVETLIPYNEKEADTPGTMDFMRDKIEHVIYYMIENRSFDHVCGWLYENNANYKVIGREGTFDGVDKSFTNEYLGKEFAITKYNNGKLPDPNTLKYKKGKPCYPVTGNDKPGDEENCFVLDLDENDPYHNNSDVLRQMFNDKKTLQKYLNGEKPEPDMGGFAINNGTREVMLSYTPEQLPVLNGLAENFAISDDWFCSMPGGTDVNRAFALTGSSLGHLDNFQNGVEYTEWSEYPHRPSIWKVLWSNGIKDFKIYNAVEWIGCQFTYNLFLKGQIPSIDNPFVIGNYAPQLNQFYDDLKYGTLPKFSFIEPKWVASNGSTSYHPGNDLIPGERTLNDIFNAIQDSPLWEKTLFVITFDEHGGIADHVKPPYAANPYPNDSIDGFNFDIMGVRIPTILVSPWIGKNTVFRSGTGISYDSTSILATLLEWSGIPKSRWCLGERTNQAPTFEEVLTENNPRQDKITLTVPYDSNFPLPNKDDVKRGQNGQTQINLANLPIHGLHELTVPRMITDMTPNLSQDEREKLTENIMSTSVNLKELYHRLDDVNKKHNKAHTTTV
ncbi:alkaline phosphatase family protein [Winogradskyella sp. A3E31]|uniref:alkaline phosphatase family protein n=1 Tax=Winogradskyella sp. A3E31 TaxID=3349637 RepID=UPI00398AC633